MLSVSNEHEITDSKWRVPQAIQQEDGQFCNTKHQVYFCTVQHNKILPEISQID